MEKLKRFIEENYEMNGNQLNIFNVDATILNCIPNIPYELESEDILIFHNTNTLDFLGKLYPIPEFEKQLYRDYMTLLTNFDCLTCTSMSNCNHIIENSIKCQVIKTNPNAIIPQKTNSSDVGYDLTIIDIKKKVDDMTTLFDTGIKIQLQYGYYAEIVARSSLSKSGYMVSNNIGIIDNSYRGNLFIALTKINPNAPDLQLPFRCCQLLIRKQYHVIMQEVLNSDDPTSRQTGGFGSTS